MKVINVRNVNQALPAGIAYLLEYGVREESRAGSVLVSPCPVTTVYERSQERVLFSPARNANCFFHLFESLWLLAGRNDARWLDQFVHDFSSRFAEDDGRLHGSYGYRWRHHFDLERGGRPGLPDQLDTVVGLLKKNPQDRQAVIQMWDPCADLGVPGLRDRPCNLNLCLRVRNAPVNWGRDTYGGDTYDVKPVLDITVFCRSNDIWWGLAGANAVQFSVLLEYLAARIGVGIGTYTQVSHNYHLYGDMATSAKTVLVETKVLQNAYPGVTPIVTNPETFDTDLQSFMEWTESEEPDQQPQEYSNSWLHLTAEPLYVAHRLWKQKEREHALEVIQNAQQMAPDWRLAVHQWMQRRLVGMVSK